MYESGSAAWAGAARVPATSPATAATAAAVRNRRGGRGVGGAAAPRTTMVFTVSVSSFSRTGWWRRQGDAATTKSG
ncbi:hypothetical protein Prubr_54820 [Polymorphospora rubra]|uniref:Uncharacterized protein n=1 Tax=Polymorphospora rubra TaxID=338584 RepID=A0A810N420_9ACTN|nr:hypothetical protein Prubr_54820 [Polymorphospora rubra]